MKLISPIYSPAEAGKIVNQKIAGYIGIAQKARKIASGNNNVLAAINSGKTKLLLLAKDIAPGIAAELKDAAIKKKVPCATWGDKAALGLAAGKSPRGSLAVLDEGLAEVINKLIQGAL